MSSATSVMFRPYGAPARLVESVVPVDSPVLPFIILLAANAVLFLRPGEIVPATIGWPIYQVAIVMCLALSLSQVTPQLSSKVLAERPVTVCVLALLPLVVASQLLNANIGGAALAAVSFTKVVVYYLLLVSLVNTPTRLRQFLFCFSLFLVALAGVAVLSYHEIITLPNLTVLKEHQEEIFGKQIFTRRLRGTGIFADPNELCLMLVLGVAFSAYWVGERRLSFLRYLWLAPLALFGYALMLTQSRGGFLALLICLLAYFYARFGKARTLLLGAVALPVLFALFDGRQTSVSTLEYTAQDRIALWSDGLDMFRSSPLFGIGYGKYDDLAGLVAHNSFIHCFAELGILGGALFLGAFYVCFRELKRLNAADTVVIDPELRRLRPYLTAGCAGYVAGLMSLSFSYAVPTYTILGVAGVYLRLAATYPPQPRLRFDARLLARFLGLAVAFLLVMYLFVRLAK